MPAIGFDCKFNSNLPEVETEKDCQGYEENQDLQKNNNII